MLKPFFKDVNNQDEMKNSFVRAMARLHNVAERFKQKNRMFNTKLYVLQLKWNKQVQMLLRKASRARNVKEAHDFATKIQKISPFVRDHLLRKFILRC